MCDWEYVSLLCRKKKKKKKIEHGAAALIFPKWAPVKEPHGHVVPIQKPHDSSHHMIVGCMDKINKRSQGDSRIENGDNEGFELLQM